MQGFWLIVGFLLYIVAPIAGLMLVGRAIDKAAAPWRHRMMARRLDAMAHELNEVQKHRKVWSD